MINIAFTDCCWICLNVQSDGVALCDVYLDEVRIFQRRLRRQCREWKPQYDRHCKIQNAMYRKSRGGRCLSLKNKEHAEFGKALLQKCSGIKNTP